MTPLMIKLDSSIVTALLLLSLTSAARPRDGTWSDGDFSASSQRKRLLMMEQQDRLANGNEAVSNCTCDQEFNTVDVRSKENERKLQQLKEELNTTQIAIGTVRDAVTAISTESGNKTRTRSPVRAPNFAFSARVGYNRFNLARNQVIVFDELVINNGDAYNPNTGKFTCQVAGLYHFETTILSGFDAAIDTIIQKNGQEMVRMHSSGYSTRGSGTNSVLLNLEPKDEVCVSVLRDKGDYVHGQWSTFSGHLVQSYGA